MTLNRRFLYFVLVAIVAVQSGCNGSKPAEDVTSNDRALSLIDQKNYNDAIVLLNKRLETNPQDNEARLLLASALAGKNGIIMTRFIQLAKTLIGKGQSRPLEGSSKWQALEWQIKFARSAFEGIPELNSHSYSELHYALQVLRDGVSSPGSYLFRAILRLGVFKYEVTHPYKLRINSDCTVSLKPLHLWFNVVSSSLHTLVGDLYVAAQDQRTKEDLERLQLKIYNVHQDVQKKFAELNEDTSELESIELPHAVKRFYSICE